MARTVSYPAQDFANAAREFFSDTGEPFALTVGGQKLYIITSPDDVAALYRNNTTLSWDAMLNELFVAFGLQTSAIPKLWENLHTLELAGKVPRPTNTVYRILDIYKRQLLPGEKLENFTGKMMNHLHRSIHFTTFRNRLKSTTPGVLSQVSLQHLCAEVLIDSTTRTLFGNSLCCVEPQLVQALVDFNEDAWKIVFHYPQTAGSKYMKAREKILRAMMAYIQAPAEIKSDQSWMINQVMVQHEAVGIDLRDRAAMLLMIYWAWVNRKCYLTTF